MKLKGEMVIELTDTNTDAVEKVQETNMITEAVNNILGLNPMGIYLKASGEYDNSVLWNGTLLPICPNMIGGILLFPAVLETAGSYLRAGEEPASGSSQKWGLLFSWEEDSGMKEFWNFIQMVFMAVGGGLGWFMGGCDGLLYALIAFVVIDYLTGVMCAFADHTLSSELGFRGICRKVLIFLLVGMANILDVAVIGNGSVLRTAVIFFYISNEGVSLLENAGHLGLPIPQKMKEVLEQLHDRSEKGDGE